MDINWDDLKENKEEFLDLVDEYGVRGLAREIGDVSHSTISRWKNKFVEGHEERKPDTSYDPDLDRWTISAKSSGRSFSIANEKYKKIRRNYSSKNYLTINELCRKYELPRWKFMLLKSAFGFTHDDVPYTDKEMMEKDTDELVEEELQRRKEQYFQKLQQKEIDSALKELENYREDEYYLEKIDNLIKNHLNPSETLDFSGDLSYNNNRELMLEIPIVDLHLDKLSWEPETNNEYNSDIAKERFISVINDVLERTEDKEFEKVLFPIGNDFFHYDDIEGHTTFGTKQTIGGRWQKMFIDGVELLVAAIKQLANTCPTVDVFLVPGNHDKQTSFYALMYLSAYFNNTTTVEVDISPKTRKYRKFGSNLLGFTHMDKEKKRIFGNMQVEVPKLWGETKYREWHGGHLHSEQVEEKNGVIVRNLSSVTANDDWHYEKGYLSQPKSQSFIWHKEKGLQNILITNID